MTDLKPDSAETRGLLEQVRQGDRRALDALLGRYRAGLCAFVDFHLDPGLRARLDASDIVQETQMELVRRMDDFLRRQPMPFHLWLRKTAYEQLLRAQRHHRNRARRTVAREVAWPERSSLFLARALIKSGLSPSQQLLAREAAGQVSRALRDLSEADREILLLRHADELPYEEIACLLEIEPAAARKRYGRALIRLQKLLSDRGLLEDQP